MFKALDQQSGEEHIILTKSREEVESLRERGRNGFLRCYQCSQPVHVKAGAIKRWHFAHDNIADCPLQNESPELLEARAVLYDWLHSKFEKGLTIEARPENADLPRPIDCLLENSDGSRVAWWIVTSSISPDKRDRLTGSFAALEITPRWVFLARMLRPDKGEAGTIILTTTEREFVKPSRYDQLFHGYGGSLHYLNAEKRELITYRSLIEFHPPQAYRGHELCHPLVEMQITMSGEIVHPGEHGQLEALRKKREEAEIKRAIQVSPSIVGDRRRTQREKSDPEATENINDIVFTCVRCGARTKDWSMIPSGGWGERKCVCKGCAAK